MYQKRKDFLKTIKRCDKTVTRFYNNYPDLEKQCRNNRKHIPTYHKVFFNKEDMIDKIVEQNNEIEMMNTKIKKLRNLVHCLQEPDNEIQKWLTPFSWTYYLTVSYKENKSKEACRKVMDNFYYYLESNYGDKTEIRLFYTTEPFTNRYGHHNHFTLLISNVKLRTTILSDFTKKFSNNIIDYQDYDKDQAGIFYSAKEGLQGIDWDLHHNIVQKQQTA